MQKNIVLALAVLALSQQAIAQKAASAAKTTNTPALVSAPAAASPHPTCAKLSRLIEGNLKKVIAERYDGLSDTSAPRATNRLLTEVSALTENHIYLTQMGSLGCPPLEKALDPDVYTPNAVACTSAVANLRLFATADTVTSAEARAKAKEACDQSKWTRIDD